MESNKGFFSWLAWFFPVCSMQLGCAYLDEERVATRRGWFAPTSYFPCKTSEDPLKIDGWKMKNLSFQNGPFFMGHVNLTDCFKDFLFSPGTLGK